MTAPIAPRLRNESAATMSNRRAFSMMLILATIATLVSWIGLLWTYVDQFGHELSSKQEIWGAFGDYIGGFLNPFLGTLTLFGVLYTVRLQRDVLAEAQRAERNQRELNQQQGFESAFFHMLDAIDTRIGQTSMKVQKRDLEPPVRDTARRRRYFASSELDDEEARGPEAFALFLKLFEAQAVTYVERGDFVGNEANAFLREKAQSLISTYDHVVGPSLRSICELLSFLAEFDQAMSSGTKNGTLKRTETILRSTSFYAGVAMNSRTRVETKVLAMYLWSGMASPEIVVIADAYNAFEIIETGWWGRRFLEFEV